MKTCTKCGLSKSLDQFSKSKSNGSSGLKSACRECSNERKRQWYAENTERANTDGRQWYAANKIRLQEKARNRLRLLRGTPLDAPVRPVNDDEAIGYSGVHQRITKSQGSAKDHSCVRCGRRAKDWSYSNACTDERLSDLGPYCVHSECYEPLCRRCHILKDGLGFAFRDDDDS